MRLESDALIVKRPADPVTTSNVVPQVHEENTHQSGASVIGQLNQQAAILRLNIASKVPAPPPVSPDDALKQINELPPPKYSDTPRNYPPEDRQALYESWLQDYNNKRAAIADEAIKNPKPPSRDDFNGLSPAAANFEYQEALRNYQSQLAALKKISREAKQGNLEMTAQFKSLSDENQALVRSQLARVEGNPADVDTLVSLVKAEGFTKLTPDEQRQLLQLVGGTDSQVSGPARQKLAGLLNDPSVSKADAETFRRFLREQPAPDVSYFDVDKKSTELIEKYTSHGFWGADLNAEGLGKEVAELAKTEPDKAAALMDDILKKIVGSDKDEVAQAFVESQSPEELRAFAANDKGREVLGQLKDQLLSGNVFPDERDAASRIDSAIKASDLEKTTEFRNLSPEAQQTILDAIAKHDKNGKAVDNILALVKSTGFYAQPPATQRRLLDTLAKRPEDTVFREALSNLVQNAEFTALDIGQQASVLNNLVKFASTKSYSRMVGGASGRFSAPSKDAVSNEDKALFLRTIGNLAIYSAQHPDIASVRNTLDHLTSGRIKVEAITENPARGPAAAGRASDDAIQLNRFPGTIGGPADSARVLVHEVNHLLNNDADTDADSAERFMAEFRAGIVGIEAANGRPATSAEIRALLDGLGHRDTAFYPQLRDLYNNDAKFRGVIDAAFNELANNPNTTITPEQMRQRLVAAGFDSDVLKTPANVDNH